MKTKATRRTQSPIIVITGTPGTGKTAISKSLAQQMHADYLSLTKLVIDMRLQAGLDRRRRTRVVDLEKTRAWLRKNLRERDAITILDTHIPDAAPRERVSRVIVLRSHPRELERRLRRKRWSTAKRRENVLAEILDSCYVIANQYYGARKIMQLDTSRTSVNKTVNQCKTLLRKRRRSQTVVDWIAALDPRTLERYML